MSEQKIGTAIVIEGETYELVKLKKYKEMHDKTEAFDRLLGYFEKSSMRSKPELFFYNSAEGVFEDYYESEESE